MFKLTLKWGLFLVIFGLTGLTADDAVDKLSRQLDVVERNFWPALRYPHEGEFRSRIRREVNNLELQARSIQNQISLKLRLKNPPNLSLPAHNLQLIFNRVEHEGDMIRRFRMNFATTNLNKFKLEYSRYQREVAKAQQAQSSTPKRRYKRSREKLTLEKIPTDLYQMFLADVTAYNIERFSRERNNGQKSEIELVKKLTYTYLGSIAMLRLNIVKLKQATKYQFKEVKLTIPQPEYME